MIQILMAHLVVVALKNLNVWGMFRNGWGLGYVS